MFSKVLGAMFVMTVSLGLVAAGEYSAVITKVDGNKVTFQKYAKGEKGKQGEKEGDAITLPLAKNATITKGKYNKTEKKLESGEAIEGGLTSETFKNEKGVRALITTDEGDKHVTSIVVMGGKGKKKNDNK